MITDVEIYESGGGGDLNLKAEDIATIQGLTNQVYLALFGGQYEQVTSEDLEQLDQRNDWWGNELFNTEFQFNSTFERRLNEVVLNSSGLIDLENAAKEDLQYLQEYADIEIDLTIDGYQKLTIFVDVIEPGKESVKIKFVWDGTKKEVIEQKIIS